MSNTDHISSAHTSASLKDPEIHAVPGFPGVFVADFGPLTMHFTAQAWDRYDSIVRAAIAATTLPGDVPSAHLARANGASA